jgi:hypothetical protein
MSKKKKKESFGGTGKNRELKEYNKLKMRLG